MAGSKHKVHFGEHLTQRLELMRSLLVSGTGIGWVMMLLLVPLMAIVVIGFWSRIKSK